MSSLHRYDRGTSFLDVYPQSWKSTLGVFYMTKISVKTKLKAVEEYANGNVTLAYSSTALSLVLTLILVI